MASASCRRMAASGSPREKSPFGLPDVFGAPYGREISVSLESSLREGQAHAGHSFSQAASHALLHSPFHSLVCLFICLSFSLAPLIVDSLAHLLVYGSIHLTSHCTALSPCSLGRPIMTVGNLEAGTGSGRVGWKETPSGGGSQADL